MTQAAGDAAGRVIRLSLPRIYGDAGVPTANLYFVDPAYGSFVFFLAMMNWTAKGHPWRVYARPISWEFC